MSRIFFITGLPRSRSAWLAAWLTLGSVLCWHDKRFSPSLIQKDRRTGFAGPELVEDFDKVQSEYPNAPWIVVLRKSDEAMHSFLKVAKPMLPPKFDLEKFWNRRCHKLAAMCEKPVVQAVAFDDLDSEHVARFIWGTCLPNIDFDRERWELFNKLRICAK